MWGAYFKPALPGHVHLPDSAVLAKGHLVSFGPVPTFPLLILLPSTQPAHAAFTIEQMLNEPYFDASDIENVCKGDFG
jgi:hypothetical protein